MTAGMTQRLPAHHSLTAAAAAKYVAKDPKARALVDVAGQSTVGG